MGFSGARKAVLVATLVALAIAGSAAAQESERGIDPNQGRSLVEVNLPDKAAAIELQLEADDYGIDFNDHYLRTNADGSVTVTVFGTEDELAALDAAGYELGTTIEGPATWRQRAEDWQADVKAEETAEAAALAESERRGGAARTRSSSSASTTSRTTPAASSPSRRRTARGDARLDHAGASLSLSWNTGAGTAIDQGPRTMNVNIDPDTTPDTYIEHRMLVASASSDSVDAAGADADPDRLEHRRVRRGDVNTWLGGGLPPMSRTSSATSRRGIWTRPRSTGASASWRRSSRTSTTIIPLPHKTNGYQRRAQALMAGLTNPACTGNLSATAASAGRHPHVARLGPRGRQRPHGRVRQPGRRRTRRSR